MLHVFGFVLYVAWRKHVRQFCVFGCVVYTLTVLYEERPGIDERYRSIELYEASANHLL